MKTQSILVPTDFSPVSNSVLPIAEELAHREKAGFSMLHTYDGDHTAMLETYRDFAVHKMKDLLDSHHLTDWPHRCYLRQGEMGTCIKKITRQQPIILVVMGKNGAGEEMESEIVLRSACPVLAVPPGTLDKEISRMVYVTQHVKNETESIREAAHFASLYDADLSVLNVQSRLPGAPERDEMGKLFSGLTYDRAFGEYIQAKDLVEGVKKYLQYNRADLVAVAGVSGGWLVKNKSRQYMRELLAYPGLPLLFINHNNKN